VAAGKTATAQQNAPGRIEFADFRNDIVAASIMK
jgi:hypothetical protein